MYREITIIQEEIDNILKVKKKFDFDFLIYDIKDFCIFKILKF